MKVEFIAEYVIHKFKEYEDEGSTQWGYELVEIKHIDLQSYDWREDIVEALGEWSDAFSLAIEETEAQEGVYKVVLFGHITYISKPTWDEPHNYEIETHISRSACFYLTCADEYFGVEEDNA